MGTVAELNHDKELVQALLERYWEGKTTNQEEKLLCDYFVQPVVADDFRAIRPYFTDLQKIKHNTKALCDETILVTEPTKNTFHLNRLRFTRYAGAAIAATIALMIALTTLINYQSRPYAIINGEKQTNLTIANATFLETMATVKIEDEDLLKEIKITNFE